MMGSTHAANGAMTGVLAAELAGFRTAAVVAAGLVTAGTALIPDLDHEHSVATHACGPLTRALNRLICSISATSFRLTRTRYDVLAARHSPGKHRYLTHTLAFTVLAGLITLAAGWRPVRLTLLAFALLLAHRGLAQVFPRLDMLRRARIPFRKSLSWALRATLATGGAWLCTDLLPGVLVAALYALGCLTHLAADYLTPSGVPLLWPVEIRGMRWRRHRAPLTIRTGRTRIETAFCWACLAAVPVSLIYLH